MLKYRREGVTRIRPFFHPTADLSPTSLVYWGEGRGVGGKISKCHLSPCEMRGLNRPGLLVEGVAHFQDVHKEYGADTGQSMTEKSD